MQDLIDVILRTLTAFVLIMVITRALGKQTISQLTYHDFVAAITLGSITGNLAFNTRINHWMMLVSLLIFSGVAYLFTVISLKSRKARKLLSGKPTMVIENGKILEHNLKKLRFSLDTLNQELREKDIFDMEEVEFAILELNGRVSVLKKSEFRPILFKDLPSLTVTNQTKMTFPIELIMDGEMIKENLVQNQLSEAWMINELKKRKVTLSDVCYAVKGTQGSLYFDFYKDTIINPISVE